MAADVTLEMDGHVATIEIRRPPTNYFDHSMLAALADLVEELQAAGQARAIVLCSEGKHFCAGADFGAGELAQDRDRASAALYREGIRLFRLELPVIAAVQGSAIGGGLGLACAADFRVASSATRFQANFAGLGFHHGFGLSITLPRIVGVQRAHELLLTARRLDGSEAFALGLADRLAEPGQERVAAHALAAHIGGLAPLAVRSIKSTMRARLADDVAAALERELSEQQRLWRTSDSRAGIAASLARTTPVFTGE